MSEERITYNLCAGWGCHEHCTLEVHSKGNEITRIQRLRTPGKDPASELCMKGVLASRLPFAKDRVLYPLKRTGERGEGKFERISWDQALDEISEKIKGTVAEHGTRSVLINRFYCGYPGDMRSMPFDYVTRLCIGLDSSMLEYQPVDFSLIYAGAIDMGFLFCSRSRQLSESNNMVVIWGGNPLGYTRPAHTTKLLLDAQERGAKIVHISNLYDVTSAKADKWIPIKSGTDAAFGLSVAHVLIRDGLVNEDFLLRRTSAAYLVRTDTGKYLRASDIVEGGSSTSFCVVGKDGEVKMLAGKDAAAAEAGDGADDFANMTVNGYIGADGTLVDNGSLEADLNAVVTINGIECKTALCMLKDHVAKWTPEYQEQFTGIAPESVVEFAHEYQAASPATMYVYFGLRYRNGVMSVRAALLVAYLTGNFGEPDGGTVILAGDQTRTQAWGVNESVIQIPPSFTGTEGEIVHFVDVLDSFEDPTKQQYKVWLNFMGNPLINWPNKDLWRNRVLPNLDLFVSFEIRLTDTAKYADYVLPDCTTFERWEFMTESDECAILSEPAIEPQGEARDYAWVINQLADRLGIGADFGYTAEDLAKMKVDFGLTGKEAIVYDEEWNEIGTEPFTFDMMKERKVARVKLPGDDVVPFDTLNSDTWLTTTGRLEFYNEGVVGLGEMADFHPAYMMEAKSEEYPLQFYAARHKYFMQGQYTNVPENRLLAKEQFGVALNPVEAAKRDMVDGETVLVVSPHGTMRVPLQLRDDIPVGMAHTWYSYNEDEYKDSGCPQDVMGAEGTGYRSTEFQNAVAPWIEATQTAMGIPQVLQFSLGGTTPECTWDNICDVRKVEDQNA